MALEFEEETYCILGACFEVYKHIGPGFLEATYQECLQMELGFRGIPFSSQQRISLFYKDQKLQQFYTPDFLCYDKIIIEIKACKDLCDEHRAQLLNYLKATNLKLGLLVNFRHYPKVQHQRLIR